MSVNTLDLHLDWTVPGSARGDSDLQHDSLTLVPVWRVETPRRIPKDSKVVLEECSSERLRPVDWQVGLFKACLPMCSLARHFTHTVQMWGASCDWLAAALPAEAKHQCEWIMGLIWVPKKRDKKTFFITKGSKRRSFIPRPHPWPLKDLLIWHIAMIKGGWGCGGGAFVVFFSSGNVVFFPAVKQSEW